MERVQKLKNVVVIRRKMKKIRKKEAGCIIFAHLDFRDDDALIDPCYLEWWCQINTEGDRNLLLSDGTLAEHLETEEVEEMAEERVGLENLAVLVEDEVGLSMQLMPTDYDNAPAP